MMVSERFCTVDEESTNTIRARKVVNTRTQALAAPWPVLLSS
jgi:hypothetical protein